MVRLAILASLTEPMSLKIIYFLLIIVRII